MPAQKATKRASVKVAEQIVTAPVGKADAKIACVVCGHRAHVLVEHVRTAHQMMAREYVEKHNAPVFSAIGADILKSIRVQSGVHSLAVPERRYEMVTLEGVFGWDGEKALVKRFSEPTPWVPAGDDEGFKYDYDTVQSIIMALNSPKRNSLWIKGPTGVGKTRIVLNTCRRLNREVVRINCDTSLGRPELLGDTELVGGETRFRYGLVPIAMMRGAVLLLDEFDLINTYTAPVLRALFEDNPQLVLTETAEVVKPHPDFRIIITANTWGTGDDSGLYGNTPSVMSKADRERIYLWRELGWLPEDAEIKMITDMVPGFHPTVAERMVRQVATPMRTQYKERQIEEPISPRQLVNWAEKSFMIGSVVDGARITFLAPLSEGTQGALLRLMESAQLRDEDLAKLVTPASESEGL